MQGSQKNMEKLTKENSVKVHAIFLYTQPFTHKLHLKMGPNPFLEQSSTVKFPSLFEPPKAAWRL